MTETMAQRKRVTSGFTTIRRLATRPLLAAACSAAVCVAWAGCAARDGGENDTGYHVGELYPATYRSVAVPLFANQTLYTGLERNITDAVIKEIQSRTPYLVVDSDQADTVLRATILRVEKSRLSNQRRTGLSQELMYTVTIELKWTESRTGRAIVERHQFETGDLYIPSNPVGELPDLAAFAVADEIARDVVDLMAGSW